MALSVAAAIATAEAGGGWMAWHLALRGHWSRFAQFLPSPARIARYLGSGVEPAAIGHNALGTLSACAFLLLLSLQVATGLVADDDVATTGPLNARVDVRLARRASGWHAGYGADLVFALIALHVLAIGSHAWRRPVHRREPLMRAMWTGDKPAPPATRASRDTVATRLFALAIWAIAAGGVGGWCALQADLARSRNTAATRPQPAANRRTPCAPPLNARWPRLSAPLRPGVAQAVAGAPGFRQRTLSG